MTAVASRQHPSVNTSLDNIDMNSTIESVNDADLPLATPPPAAAALPMPSLRRRVEVNPSPPAYAAACNSAASPARGQQPSPLSPARQNDPYAFNVLGEHATIPFRSQPTSPATAMPRRHSATEDSRDSVNMYGSFSHPAPHHSADSSTHLMMDGAAKPSSPNRPAPFDPAYRQYSAGQSPLQPLSTRSPFDGRSRNCSPVQSWPLPPHAQIVKPAAAHAAAQHRQQHNHSAPLNAKRGKQQPRAHAAHASSNSSHVAPAGAGQKPGPVRVAAPSQLAMECAARQPAQDRMSPTGSASPVAAKTDSSAKALARVYQNGRPVMVRADSATPE
jgi:hypothetical protein